MSQYLTPGSRDELFTRFHHTITSTYDELLENQRLNYKQNMLKTFLIESNVSPGTLEERFEPVSLRNIDYRLDELRINESQGNEDDVQVFYLDYQDERFWALYSLDKSDDAKGTVKKLINIENSGLDYLWFPVQFQRYITSLGDFEGVGLNYDANAVFPESYVEDHLPFGDLSIQSTGRGTRWLLDKLSGEELQSFLSLSAVRIRREINGRQIIERVDKNGQITTRGGDDIDLHLDFISLIRDTYAEWIRSIEDNHRISYPARTNDQGEPIGQTIDGNPLAIDFNNPIPDLEIFAENISDATFPLRLWGTTAQLSRNYYKVNGLDLHNNDDFTIELKNNWLRLYLPEDACGNTALRIFTNIQRYFDADASLSDEEPPEIEDQPLSA